MTIEEIKQLKVAELKYYNKDVKMKVIKFLIDEIANEKVVDVVSSFETDEESKRYLEYIT